MLTHVESELWEMKESSKSLFLASFCSLSFPTLTLPTGGHCVNYGGSEGVQDRERLQSELSADFEGVKPRTKVAF